MKQQNKRPPKPKQQQQQTQRAAVLTKNSGSRVVGKENTVDQNKVSEPNLQHTAKQMQNAPQDKDQTSQNQKQRFKNNNGGNRSSSQQDTKRPHQTSNLLANMQTGQNQIEQKLKLQRQLHSALGNTTQFGNNTQTTKQEHASLDDEDGSQLLRQFDRRAKNPLDNSLGSWIKKQDQPNQFESKYSSTRNRQTVDLHKEAAITGRRVDQPRVVVADVDSKDFVFHNERFSPQRDKQSSGQIKKTSKKSKSQTIQGAGHHTQKNAWANKLTKPKRLLEFLDQSIINPPTTNNESVIDVQLKREEGNEKDLTLKILTSTADNMNLGQIKNGQRQRPKSMERSKVQMKYLNFQRENVLKSQTRQNRVGQNQSKRCTTALNNVQSNRNFEKDLNKTQSTSADRIHRLAGSYSPHEKSGGGLSTKQQTKDARKYQRKQKKDQNILTKSANEMQATGGISTLAFAPSKNESDKSTLQFRQPFHQNQSTIQGPIDQSQISLAENNAKKYSQQSIKKHKTSMSPERAAKIDKFIRENIKRERQEVENRKKEMKERDASSLKRKKFLEQKNEQIRQVNKEKIQRRRIKLKENITISGDEQDGITDTKLLERALLAASDGVQDFQAVTKNFDSRSSQKVFNRGGLRTQQIGVSNNSKLQLTNLQKQPDIDLSELHRRSQGLDFLDVRKEISNELRLTNSKSRLGGKFQKKDRVTNFVDSAFMLQTSKSQKQDFVPLRSQNNATSNSIYQGTNILQQEKKSTLLQQVKQENMLFKRKEIRKFMREKAKILHTKVQKEKAEEFNNFKKVRTNLTNLNNFVQRKLNQPTFTSGITTPALKVKRQHKKNVTVFYDENVGQSTALRQNRHQDRTITPTKGGLFENSDVSLNISGKNHRGQNRSILGQLTHKDIQKLHDTLYEDSRLSSIQTIEERSIKRGNGAQTALGVCFEKSASQKALRKYLQASPIPESRNSSKKRPRSALNINSVGRSLKRKIKSAKRSKSQSGNRKLYLPVQGKLSVRLLADEKQKMQALNNNQIDENLKLTHSAAAKIIQKEVRKFLSNLGFYEARQIDDPVHDPASIHLSSGEHSQQINLFIEPMRSRERSPNRNRSNSSKQKSKQNYSPDYELIQPSSSKKPEQFRQSPKKLLKPKRIEKLSIDETEVRENRNNAALNISKHSSDEQYSSQKRRANQQTNLDSLSLIEAAKSSAERKRASAEVRNIQPLNLIGIKPTKTKDIQQNARIDYHGSSNGSSQQPGIWGPHSVTTPQSQKHLMALKSHIASQSPHLSDLNQQIVDQNGDAISQTSSSIFDRNSFQQFSKKKLSHIMKNNEFQKLIQFREECLVFREKKEKKHINKLLNENQMTPRTYQQKKLKIERWVSIQRAEIEKTKQGFKEEWDKTVQMIEDTQKNVDQMKIIIGSVVNNNVTDSNSYSQPSSRFNGGKPPRSILIDEAPKSYRSGIQDQKLLIQVGEDETSLGILSSRRQAVPLSVDRKSLDGGRQGEKFENTSKSEIKGQRESRDRSSSDVLHIDERQQSMTGEKGKEYDRLIDGSRHRSSIGNGQETENQSSQDQLPSAAFLNRLERATQGMLPQDSAEGTLNIEEHSFAEDLLLEENANISRKSTPTCQQTRLEDERQDKQDRNLKLIDSSEDTFEDGNFKNRLVQIKGLNQLLANESNGNSEVISDHKSEPQMFDASDFQEDLITDSKDLKISDMLKKKPDFRQILNYEDEKELIQEPAIISQPGQLVPAVTIPMPPLSALQSDEYKLKLVDQITEQLIQNMITESFQVPSRDKKSKKQQNQSQLQSNDQDIYIIDALAMDKDEKKEWIEIRQRHLIEGSLIRADQYVNELLDVLLQFDISDISENSDFEYDIKPTDNFHIQFLKLLTQPILRQPYDTLTQMQTSELGSYIHFETTLDIQKHPIVPVDLYLEIEKAREESLITRRKVADKKTQQVWESVHIFNKCIFDAINESLMKFRPYGIVGEPMPWSNKVRRLQTKVEIASVDTERLFQMVKQEIFRWTQVFCGCLPGPVFYFPNPRTGRDEFQEDLLQEVRERRLTQVLTQDTVEHEHHWLNYEFEEAQVKIDVSDMILETLVGELIGFLQLQQLN